MQTQETSVLDENMPSESQCITESYVTTHKLEHPPLETAPVKHPKIQALIPAVLVGAAALELWALTLPAARMTAERRATLKIMVVVVVGTTRGGGFSTAGMKLIERCIVVGLGTPYSHCRPRSSTCQVRICTWTQFEVVTGQITGSILVRLWSYNESAGQCCTDTNQDQK